MFSFVGACWADVLQSPDVTVGNTLRRNDTRIPSREEGIVDNGVDDQCLDHSHPRRWRPELGGGPQ